MKKLMFLLLAANLTSAQADELKSFNDISNSISSGKNIKMIINFDNCSPKLPVANVNVFTAPTAIMLRNNYLQFANSPLTTNNPHFLKKPVIENCTYKITDNNEINIITRVITLPDYTVAEEIHSVCQLGKAVKVFN